MERLKSRVTILETEGKSQAEIALLLLDHRRIRRLAIARDFDLAPDLEEEEEQEEEKKKQQQQQQQQQEAKEKISSSSSSARKRSSSPTRSTSPTNRSSSSSSSSSNTTSNNSIDPNCDFRIFGRIIPRNSQRDHTRRYLLQNFPMLAAPFVPPPTSSSSSSSATAAAQDDSTTSSSLAEDRQALEEKRAKLANSRLTQLQKEKIQLEHQKEQSNRKAARLSLSQHKKCVAENTTHRKLFNAALGELSADFSSLAAGPNKFRKLIRSSSADVEERETKLLAVRRSLPLQITATTMYIPRAFEDRPPSPRTLALQTRRLRLAEMLGRTCSPYMNFLTLTKNPTTCFWMLDSLLKNSRLAPTSSFFASSSSSSQSQQQQQNVFLRGGVALVIRPDTLEQNFKHLPWSVLSDSDVDFLMSFFAPEYSAAKKHNKEAERRKEKTSLLVNLAKTRKETSGGAALDDGLASIVKEYDEATKQKEVSLAEINIEAGLRKLCRACSFFAVQEKERKAGKQQQKEEGEDDDDEDDGGNNNSSSNNMSSTSAHSSSLALLCYSALLPRALRNSNALLHANASCPPPAITKGWLQLAEAEYRAVGDDELASLVARYATLHIHVSHVALGHNVQSCIEKNRQNHPPTPFSRDLAEVVDDCVAGEDATCDFCACCYSSSYSYVDSSTILQQLRNRSNISVSVFEQFERQILEMMAEHGEVEVLEFNHDIQRQQKKKRTSNQKKKHTNKKKSEEEEQDDDSSSDDDDRSDYDNYDSEEEEEVSPNRKNNRRSSSSSSNNKKNSKKKNASQRREISLRKLQLEQAKKRKEDVEAALGQLKWRCHLSGLSEALSAFDSSTAPRRATLDDNYFATFCSLLVESPQFAAFFASTMLKQLVAIGRKSQY